jgi:hypothetical protein
LSRFQDQEFIGRIEDDIVLLELYEIYKDMRFYLQDRVSYSQIKKIEYFQFSNLGFRKSLRLQREL